MPRARAGRYGGTLGGIVLLIGMGVACRYGRLPLNDAVGLRLPSLMGDDETWTRGHRAAWALICASGLGPVVVGLAVVIGVSGQAAWVIGGFAWLLVLIVLASVRATRAVARTDQAPR